MSEILGKGEGEVGAVTSTDRSSNVRTDDLLELIEDLAKQVDTLTKVIADEKKNDDGFIAKYGAALIGLIGLLLVLLVGWAWQRINTIDDRQVDRTQRITKLEEQESEDRKDSEQDRADMQAVRKQQEEIKKSIENIEIMMAQEGWNPSTKSKNK